MNVRRGTVAYNLALGDKRANAADNIPISLGIPISKADTISYGKESRSALRDRRMPGQDEKRPLCRAYRGRSAIPSPPQLTYCYYGGVRPVFDVRSTAKPNCVAVRAASRCSPLNCPLTR